MKLEQFSVSFDRAHNISHQWQFSILASLRIVPNQKKSGPKNMPQIIIKERKAYLASYFYKQEILIIIKNMSLSQLYQPPRTPFSHNTYIPLATFVL